MANIDKVKAGGYLKVDAIVKKTCEGCVFKSKSPCGLDDDEEVSEEFICTDEGDDYIYIRSIKNILKKL